MRLFTCNTRCGSRELHVQIFVSPYAAKDPNVSVNTFSKVAIYETHQGANGFSLNTSNQRWLFYVERLVPPHQIDDEGTDRVPKYIQFQQTNWVFVCQAEDGLNTEPGCLETHNRFYEAIRFAFVLNLLL